MVKGKLFFCITFVFNEINMLVYLNYKLKKNSHIIVFAFFFSIEYYSKTIYTFIINLFGILFD